MNDIIKTIKLEDSSALIDGVSETVKHEMKKQKFLETLLAPSAASKMQPVTSSVVKDISGRGIKQQQYMKKKFISPYPSFKRYRDY